MSVSFCGCAFIYFVFLSSDKEEEEQQIEEDSLKKEALNETAWKLDSDSEAVNKETEDLSEPTITDAPVADLSDFQSIFKNRSRLASSVAGPKLDDESEFPDLSSDGSEKPKNKGPAQIHSSVKMGNKFGNLRN